MAKIRVTIHEDEDDINNSSIEKIEALVGKKWMELGTLSAIGLSLRAKKLVKVLMGK